MARLPLEGVRVVDMTVVIGAPFGTLLLSEMGAEVIRIESINHFSSTTRGTMAHPPKPLVPAMGPVGGAYPDYEPGERPWNRFGLFNCHGHNKLSMTADVSTDRGKSIIKDMVAVSDLVIDNQLGFMENFGLGYETLRAVRPDIIMISISGMGATGPYKRQVGYGAHFENLMGHGWLRGNPEDHPLSITTTVVSSDPASGAALVWSAMAALEHRDRTGQGQFIEMSMAEMFIHHLGYAYLDYALNGRVQRTTGNRHPWMAPHGCYPCRGDDKWVAIAIDTDEKWLALRQAMGNPEWAQDPAFDDGYRRLRNQDTLDKRIGEWTSQRAHLEIQRLLQAVGVPAGALLDTSEIFVDPHLRERGFFRRVEHAEAGTHDYGFQFWKLSKTPVEARTPPPLLGEHNPYCYRELLGIDAEAYNDLEQQRQIGMDYAPGIP